MMVERIDELDRYYAPIEVCDRWVWRTFIASATLSVLIPYSNLVQNIWIEQLVSVAFVILVITHTLLSYYNSFYLIPIAENRRRKQLLSDSLGVPLTSEKTHLYYNNEVAPSVFRLGANVMENSFFSTSICNEMAKGERKKVLVYLLLWLFAILNRSTDLNLVLTLTQALFSGEILIRWIKIEILCARSESIYEKLYSLYLNRKNSEENGIVAGILDAFASYESAKAAASIKQPNNVFNKLNPRLTEEWDNIRERLHIGENDS